MTGDKTLKVTIVGSDPKRGIYDQQSMTSITVTIPDGTDLFAAKGLALAEIVKELYRYGLTEALQGIGIWK
jgi:hypothetical protein